MIEIKRYTQEYFDLWDDFIFNKCRNATFLHSRKFFSYNPSNAIDDFSLLFFKKSKLICVLPAVKQVSGNNTILNSHMRSTYGGFVYGNIGTEDILQIVTDTVAYAKEQGFTQILIRPSFNIFHTSPSDEQAYALWRNGFDIYSREVEIAVQLTTVENIEKRYADNNTRNIKKAVKNNITFSQTEDYNRAWEILSINLDEKHGLKPVHSLQDILLLKQLLPDNIKLFGAYLDGVMIAMTLIFVKNKFGVHGQYFGIDSQYQDYRPMNLLIDGVAKWALANNFKYFNLGTPNENKGRDINTGLLAFKESFGGTAVLRETMLLNL